MPEIDKTATTKKESTIEEDEVYLAYDMHFNSCTFNNCVFVQTGKPKDPPDDPPGITAILKLMQEWMIKKEEKQV